MDYIGYLGLLSQQVDKVETSSFDHGQFEFSTSTGESLNRMSADTDYKNSNNDWNELTRKANESGLKKMDAIKDPQFDIDKMIRDVKNSRVPIWNDEIKKTFDDVEKKFSARNKRIIKLLRSHDWRKHTEIPDELLKLKNGPNIVKPPMKKRKMNNLFAQFIH